MPELVAFNIGEAVEDLLAFAAADRPKFPTGFYGLDTNCGTVGPAELGLVLARSGSGKSTLLLNIIRNTPDIPTCVFNMEMTPRRQAEWLACMTCSLPVPARLVDETLRAGTAGDNYAEVVNSLRSMRTHYPHLEFISPSEAPTVSDLQTAVEQLSVQTGTRIQRVFIDHLTRMHNAGDYDGVQRTARELHGWARADEIAVVCVQQTGRGGGTDGGRNDGHFPVTLSSGVYGGEDAADWVWGMYRPERNPKFYKLLDHSLSAEKHEEMSYEYERLRGVVKLQLVKNRPYGETNDFGIQLKYDSDTRLLTEGM